MSAIKVLSLDDVRLGLSRFPKDTPLHVVFAYACEQSAKALHISRVSIWLFVENNTALRCVNLYEIHKDEHSAGAILRVSDYPAYFQALNICKSVPAEVARLDPRTAELAEHYMQPLGISSLLDAGLFLEGELVGVVCHEHIGLPLKFSHEARDFATSIADLVALRMQTAELQELKAVFRTQEHRLLASEKAEALAQMAAGVAHDFNNILTIINGHAELLRSHVADPAMVKPIADAAERGHALVKELVDFARPEKSGPPGVIDVSEVLADFLPIIRSTLGSRHRLTYRRDTREAFVLMNRTAFCRIAFNLAINARDSMVEQGFVTLRIASVKTRDRHGQVLHYIMLEVNDTGCGMDATTLKRIGEPYFTTKQGGTGLGLAIVKKNVNRAGGSLRAESELGKGTTFRVFLPRVGSCTGDTEEFPALEG